MKVTIEGNLLAIYKTPDFKSKETGEVTLGKSKLQLLVQNELQNGEIRQEVKDITVSKERLKEFEAQIGKTVHIKCDFMSEAQVNFYIR